MNVVLLIIAIHAGLCAACFAVAGVLQFQDFEKLRPFRNGGRFESPVGTMIASAIDSIFKNWRKRPTARRFIYAAFFFLTIMTGALYLRMS